MANIVQGSAFLVAVDDQKLTCQLDSTITMSQDMESEDACKSISGTDSIRWADDTAGQKSWEVSGSGKVEDTDKATKATLRALVEHWRTSNKPIEVSVGTNDPNLSFVETYTGTAQITSLTANLPANGSATYDYTFTGKGALGHTVTPKVP